MSYERVLLAAEAAEPFDVPASDLSKVSKINKGKVLYAGIIISVDYSIMESELMTFHMYTYTKIVDR